MPTKPLVCFSVLAMFLGCGTAAWAAADQAVVRKPGEVPLEVGQALVGHRGDHCVALLPTHVVDEASVPSLRYVGAGQATLGDLVDIRDLGGDLSMGTVLGGITRNCGHSLDSFSRAVDQKLSESTQGTLRFVNGDGSLGFEPVVWLDDDRQQFIRIRPASARGVLRKGMSGSLLMTADNTPIGMLLSVSTRSGVGTVMRIDRLLERGEQALSDDRSAAQLDKSATASPRGPESSPMTLAAWTAPAASSVNRAANLLSADPATPPWITSKLDGPVLLDFEVAPGTAITGIVLDAKGVDPSLRPVAAEIVLGNDAQFRYARSVWGGDLVYSESSRRSAIALAPTRARIIRIKLYPSGSKRLSLRRIRLMD
ncbi:hypothetical protein [Salinisphaera sp. T31B1]|uniref:hypothetical protein n=1 Tax=Salinisphaera sp. T31B1 TaxID=727963 RepID=UPI00333F4A4C